MPSLPPIRPEDEEVALKSRPGGAFDSPEIETHQAARFDYLLRLGDDALILGQRLSEWCGHAPAVEVDLSLANLALDLIGQAILRSGEAEMRTSSAFHRDVLDFKNCLLVEQPNGDFARTMARSCSIPPGNTCCCSGSPGPRPLPRRICRQGGEGSRLPSRTRQRLDVRLGDGTEESARRMADGLDWCWRFIPELFEVDEHLEALIAAEWPPIRAVRAGISRPLRRFLPTRSCSTRRPAAHPGRAAAGHHSEHLGHLLAIMQFLPRTYPDAQW
jgi:ring-1,2-phenylacetyl-CoA epoxidase subunit PaaC